MSPKIKGVIRQGDVLLLPLENAEISGKKLSHLTLANGEVTGHSHRISTGKAELYQRDGVLYLRVLSPEVTLKHEEHKNLKIPYGDWMIRIQREYQPVKNNIKKYSQVVNQQSPVKSLKTEINKSQKNTIIQKNTVTQENSVTNLETNSSATNPKIADEKEHNEMQKLASQINVNYWEKLVSDAEKKKEYLDKIQSKSKEKETDSQEGENSEPIKKKIKYTEPNSLKIKLDGLPAFKPQSKPNFSLDTLSKTIESISLNPLDYLPTLPPLSLPKIPKKSTNSTVSNSKVTQSQKVTQIQAKILPKEQPNWRNVVD